MNKLQAWHRAKRREMFRQRDIAILRRLVAEGQRRRALDVIYGEQTDAFQV